MRRLAFTAFMVFACIFRNASAQEFRIKGVDFVGNKTLSDSELSGQMNLKPKSGIQKLLFWKKAPDFIPSILEEDLARLKSYYNRNGFLNPEISSITDTTGRKVSVTIKISEDGSVYIRSLDLKVEGDSIARSISQAALASLPVKRGERFTDAGVFDSEAQLRKAWSDLGYPLAEISHDIKLSADTTECDLLFLINAGKRSFFGEVNVKGDKIIPESFIRRYLVFSEGDLFSQKKLDRTQQDLFATSLFRYVVVTPEKDSITGSEIPVTILLKEMPRWQLETGIGYGTEDRIRLAAQVTRLNFLGGARRLIINAKTSYFQPFSFDIKFIQPGFIIPRLSLVVNPFIRRDREIRYSVDRIGGSVSFPYRLRKGVDAHLTYSIERDRINQIRGIELDPSELKHNKSVITAGIRNTSSDDPFYPTKGYRLTADVSYAGIGFSRDVHYYKLNFTLVNYFSPAENLVLATKLSSGVIQAIGTTARTPLEERFFLGGASSLRGWGRHMIPLINEPGYAVGGNTVFEGSVELRFPIYNIINGAVFTDLGNVRPETYRYDPGNMHYDAGVGLRIRTPIGPVRLDFASPVISDGFDFQFFISVGHAF